MWWCVFSFGFSSTIIKNKASSYEMIEQPNYKPIEKRALCLLRDPHASLVEEHRILCGGCGTWVPLQDEYCLSSWNTHAMNCMVIQERYDRKYVYPIPQQPVCLRRMRTVSEDNISRIHSFSRTTEEERSQFLRDDSRLLEVEPRRVLCGLCGTWIKLRQNTRYCKTPWLVHVEKCSKRYVGHNFNWVL